MFRCEDTVMKKRKVLRKMKVKMRGKTETNRKQKVKKVTRES